MKNSSGDTKKSIALRPRRYHTNSARDGANMGTCGTFVPGKGKAQRLPPLRRMQGRRHPASSGRRSDFHPEDCGAGSSAPDDISKINRPRPIDKVNKSINEQFNEPTSTPTSKPTSTRPTTRAPQPRKPGQVDEARYHAVENRISRMAMLLIHHPDHRPAWPHGWPAAKSHAAS